MVLYIIFVSRKTRKAKFCHTAAQPLANLPANLAKACPAKPDPG
jgi:hypothetical protein